MSEILIGGAPVITLTAPTADEPLRLTSASFAAGRALMLLKLKARHPALGEIDLIASPPLDEAARRLSGEGDDRFGNQAYAFGGAILAPFANRITGRAVEGRTTILTEVMGRTVELPANWGGKADGAQRYAMHGLILDQPVEELTVGSGEVRGAIDVGDFDAAWPGRLQFEIEWRLSATLLTLQVRARNTGEEPCPVGLGWHPYFAVPSGDRRQAVLRIPAKSRAIVNNYDEVLPTGEVEDVAGTAYDFRRGRPLGDLYLDDCFLDLETAGDEAAVEIVDPAADVRLRIASPSPPVCAVQTYAPPDKPFVVVEPQFNLADPYGPEWRGRETRMAVLAPGESTTYEARVELSGARHG